MCLGLIKQLMELIIGNNNTLIKFENLTAIQDISIKKSNILVHPNPSSGKITISNRYITKKTVCRIFSSNGQAIDEFAITNTKSQYTFDENIKNGLYYIQISEGKTFESLKIMLVR